MDNLSRLLFYLIDYDVDAFHSDNAERIFATHIRRYSFVARLSPKCPYYPPFLSIYSAQYRVQTFKRRERQAISYFIPYYLILYPYISPRRAVRGPLNFIYRSPRRERERETEKTRNNKRREHFTRVDEDEDDDGVAGNVAGYTWLFYDPIEMCPLHSEQLSPHLRPLPMYATRRAPKGSPFSPAVLPSAPWLFLCLLPFIFFLRNRSIPYNMYYLRIDINVCMFKSTQLREILRTSEEIYRFL